MTEKEILQQAIEKAEKNGYKLTQASFDFLMTLLRSDKPQMQEVLSYFIQTNQHYQIIFDKDFAKAFWGEEKFNTINWNPWPYLTIEKWRYHLSQLVMLEEPLKYLENFL